MIYRYKALNAAGKTVTGKVEADSGDAAIAQLRGQALLPISVVAVTRFHWGDWLSSGGLSRQRAARAQLAQAIRDLVTLLEAGLPLDRALTTLAGLDDLTALSTSFTAVRDRIRAGASLADALSTDPLFPRMAVSMVRAGEMGGNLSGTLAKLADYLLRAQGVRDAVVSALIYPAVLTATGIGSMLVIVLFVIPQFEPLFHSAGKELPLALAVMLALREVVETGWWLGLAAMLAAPLALKRAGPLLRHRLDAALLTMPILGRIATLIQVEQISRSLGALLANGVELPIALKITCDSITNQAMAAAMGAAATGLREGEALADKLAATGMIPAITLDFIRVGEETGRLDEMFVRHADMCERSLRHRIERLLALLVPALTIIFGFMVAGLVGSIIIAILAANDLAT